MLRLVSIWSLLSKKDKDKKQNKKAKALSLSLFTHIKTANQKNETHAFLVSSPFLKLLLRIIIIIDPLSLSMAVDAHHLLLSTPQLFSNRFVSNSLSFCDLMYFDSLEYSLCALMIFF